MTKELERRVTSAAVELRASADDARRIGGYAAKFMRQSQNLGGFVEQIDVRFFNKSAGDGWPDVMARYNHTELLATTAAGSLRLSLDAEGLVYEADLLSDSLSDRVLQLTQRGDISKSSFAFYTFEDDWTLNDQGMPLRTLISGKLVDVAPVDQPAYLDTSTGLRSLAEARDLDVDEVTRMAASNDLASLIKPAPLVIDLGERKNVDQPEQVVTTPSGRVQTLLRALELNRQH